MTLRALAPALLALPLVLASQAFGQDAGQKLARALSGGDAEAAVQAVAELARTDDVRTARRLLKTALAVPSLEGLGAEGRNRVLDAVQAALAGLQTEDARAYLRRECERARTEAAQILLLEVLAESADPKDRSLVATALSSRHEEVVLCALGLARAKKIPETVGPLIDLVERHEPAKDRIYVDAHGALARITGEALEDAAAWKGWWKAQGESFDPSKAKGERDASPTVTREVPTLFGTEIASDRVVFLLDISNSMLKVDAGALDDGGGADQTRIARAKRALIKVIEALPGRTRFNVVAFEHQLRPWQASGDLVPATPKNKADAVAYVEGLHCALGTSTDYALEDAFRSLVADTFYLLTDGAPWRSGSPLPIRPILEDTRDKNRFRKVRIHTLGFPEANERFLKRLARQNDGTYKPIR